MRRHLLTLALMGIVGVLASGEAQACHKKKCAPAPVCAPAPCVEVAPCPPPAPVCEPAPVCAPAPKKCGLFHGGGCGHKKISFCHKKAVCAPAPCVVEAPCAPAPVVYAAPQVMPSAQVYASGQ